MNRTHSAGLVAAMAVTFLLTACGGGDSRAVDEASGDTTGAEGPQTVTTEGEAPPPPPPPPPPVAPSDDDDAARAAAEAAERAAAEQRAQEETQRIESEPSGRGRRAPARRSPGAVGPESPAVGPESPAVGPESP